MSDFNINGFLGSEKIMHKIRSDYANLFNFSESLNQFLLLEKDKFLFDTSEKNIIIGLLLCKSITSYQTTILVLNYGLPKESEVLLRSLMETTFLILACCNVDDFYNEYRESHNYHRLRLARNIINNKISINISSYYSNEEIEGIKEAYKKAQELEIKICKIAKKANMEEYFLTQYWSLCQSAHVSPKSIEHYLNITDKNKMFDITPKVTRDDVLPIVLLSSDLIFKILNKLYEYFKLEKPDRFCELHKKYDGLLNAS